MVSVEEPSVDREALLAPMPRWEKRLLGSPVGPLYRAVVTVCSLALLASFAHVPTTFLKLVIWRRIGRRYIFRRGYSIISRTVFGAEIQCSMKDIIQCYIMFFGIWEPNLTNFLERRLSSGDIFIDIGANIGYFTLLASRLVGKTGAVIAIEAAPHIFHALEENLARNNVQNARAVPVAVAAEHGTVGLYSGGIDNLGATTMIPTRGHGPVLLQVEADRLDKIVTPLELSRARIIKIDIEGAELPPLETSHRACTPAAR